jgi:hypothetical protein
LGQSNSKVRSETSVIEQSHNGDASAHGTSSGKSLADLLFPETLMPGNTVSSDQTGAGEAPSIPLPASLSGGQNNVRFMPQYNQDPASGVTAAMRLITDLQDALAREKLRAETTSLELARAQEQLASLKANNHAWACHALDPRGIGSVSIVPNPWPAFPILPSAQFEQGSGPQLGLSPVDREWPPLQTGAENSDAPSRSEELPEEQTASKPPASPPSLTLTQIEEERLIRRAETLLRNNDLGSARLLLRGVAEMGSNRAHLLLAETYSSAAIPNCGADIGSNRNAHTQIDACKAPSATASDVP